MSQDHLRQSIGSVLDNYAGEVVAAYLFGSMAAGGEGPMSDVDIAVLCSGRVRSQFDLKMRLHADLCRVLKRNDIDLIVLNSSSNLVLQEEIVRNGLLIFDGDTEAREEYEVRAIHSGIDFRSQRRMAAGF